MAELLDLHFEAGFIEAVRIIRTRLDDKAMAEPIIDPQFVFNLLDQVLADRPQNIQWTLDHDDQDMPDRKRRRITEAAEDPNTAIQAAVKDEEPVAVEDKVNLFVGIPAITGPSLSAAQIPIIPDFIPGFIPPPAAPAAEAMPIVHNVILPLSPRGFPTTQQWNEMGLQLNSTHKAVVCRGMFLNREFTINGRLAFTIPREQPCRRCVRAGTAANCRVRDPERENYIHWSGCHYCVRRGSSCGEDSDVVKVVAPKQCE